MLVEPPGTAGGLAIALFLGLALLAELKPVPLEEDDLSTVSLAFVFILAGVILFGWDAGVLIAAVSASAAQVAERKPLVRILFNTAVYSLSAFAAALPVLLLGPTAEHDPLAITLAALVGGAAFVAVNFAFISLAISFHQEIAGAPAAQGGAPARRAGVRHPGVPRRTCCRALGHRRAPARPHGRAALHGDAVPALVARVAPCDARLAHGQPHRDRQQPRVRDDARRGARPRDRDGDPDDALPRRRRRLQADQRRVRASARRPGARRGRGAPAPRRRTASAPSASVGTSSQCSSRAARRSRARTSRRSTAASPRPSSRTAPSRPSASGPRRSRTTPPTCRRSSARRTRRSTGRSRTARTVRARTARRSPRRPHRASSSGASSTRPACERPRTSFASSTRRTSTRAPTPSGSRSSSRRSRGGSGCDDQRVEQLKLAGRLHDLGKIAIPDRVLQKPGSLTLRGELPARAPPGARRVAPRRDGHPARSTSGSGTTTSTGTAPATRTGSRARRSRSARG